MNPALPDSDGFDYRDGQLHCEDLALAALAERFGTPLYAYSRRAIERAYDRYADPWYTYGPFGWDPFWSRPFGPPVYIIHSHRGHRH